MNGKKRRQEGFPEFSKIPILDSMGFLALWVLEKAAACEVGLVDLRSKASNEKAGLNFAAKIFQSLRIISGRIN